MNYIDYEENNDNLCPELDIKIGSRKYFEKFEDDIMQDPFNPFIDAILTTDGFKQSNSSLFDPLPKVEFDPISADVFHNEFETLQSLQARIKREESGTTFDEVTVNCSVPDPISSKSKLIQKREKAKQRSQAKLPKVTEEAVLTGAIPAKYIPPEFNEATLDEKSKKKMLQMIRNRISAQNSRDRRKNLIETLENKQRELAEENLKLKNRVRQLEDMNAQLLKENQEFRKTMANALSVDSHDMLFEHSDNTESAECTSGSDSPILRMRNRSGSFMKYSLALATIFAVVMFTGMNPVTKEQATGTMLSTLPQQTVFQIPAPKETRGRILEEEILEKPAVSSKDLMLRMEEETSSNEQCISTDLEDYSFVNQINDLQRNFNEKYMSKFFSQLKVDPLMLQQNQQQQPPSLKTHSEGKALIEYNFSTYLRSSRKQLPDNLKQRDHSRTQLALPFTDSNLANEMLKGDKFSSVFCPAGFEFQLEEQESSIKVEEGASRSPSQKKLKLKDSEWLQLFVPKANLSIVKSSSQNELSVSSLESKTEDGTMLEVWCKVFYVRELPSSL